MIISRPKEEIAERSQYIRKDFESRYNTDQLRQELFDEQSGTCWICRKPLQSADSVVTAIDHAIPVAQYATWDFTLDEAASHANQRRNLIAAHTVCNSVKSSWDYEEFVEQLTSGEVSLEEPKMLTPSDIQRLKDRASTWGHKGMAAILAKDPNCQSKAGKKGGLANVASGRLARLRTPEHQKKAGRARGQKSVESGHIRALGQRVGRKNVESGHFDRIRLPLSERLDLLARARTSEHQREAGQAASHSRYHVKGWFIKLKNWHSPKPNPRCALCSEQSLVIAYA